MDRVKSKDHHCMAQLPAFLRTVHWKKEKKVYNQWRLPHAWLTLGHFRSCSQRMWIVNSKIFRMLLCPDGQRLIYSRGLLSVVLALVLLHWCLNSVSLWGKTSIYVCGKEKQTNMWGFISCECFCIVIILYVTVIKAAYAHAEVSCLD